MAQPRWPSSHTGPSDAAPQRITLWDLTRDRPRTSLDLAAPAGAPSLVSLALGPRGRTLCAARLSATATRGLSRA
ncbi:hypothetical protein Scel_17670 [Streptomyces cellostaticus]|nr:hypothetical protein Scel_17670 [Streptomyces cellostaticus]